VGSPAAVLAFKGRYTTHGWIYAVTVVVVMILATTGMHFKGIQDEKDFDGAG
jgi:NO-binding membrane sensor protein with MHYT domain